MRRFIEEAVRRGFVDSSGRSPPLRGVCGRRDAVLRERQKDPETSRVGEGRDHGAGQGVLRQTRPRQTHVPRSRMIRIPLPLGLRRSTSDAA